ncbi:MAG: protoporphyrin/coproporphyrin ferrochelatase [Eubacteriales bacterium]|nr:protoporphyrin/coproporphyrin ferrochelatase [Eubacteriales bacterium]MDN5363821.1 protoporphyrin/coproporphyrin ferrochelatase [Eubacteriales bacterium]
MAEKGVLLMAFGGPEKSEEIEPFVRRVMEGRKLPEIALARIVSKYRRIGGASPLPAIVRRQAQLLAEELHRRGFAWAVKVGMGYWRPEIEEALQELEREGVEEVATISLSPYESSFTTGLYRQKLTRYQPQRKNFRILPAPMWHRHPLYIRVLCRLMAEALPEEVRREEVALVFSAHSLPVSGNGKERVYVQQLEETVELVLQESRRQWGSVTLAFQSRNRGRRIWLEPDTGEVLRELAAKGWRRVLLVPLGFTCDHVETLYDIDVEIKQIALEAGMEFYRAGVLNTAPEFIAMLADLSQKVLAGKM